MNRDVRPVLDVQSRACKVERSQGGATGDPRSALATSIAPDVARGVSPLYRAALANKSRSFSLTSLMSVSNPSASARPMPPVPA